MRLEQQYQARFDNFLVSAFPPLAITFYLYFFPNDQKSVVSRNWDHFSAQLSSPEVEEKIGCYETVHAQDDEHETLHQDGLDRNKIHIHFVFYKIKANEKVYQKITRKNFNEIANILSQNGLLQSNKKDAIGDFVKIYDRFIENLKNKFWKWACGLENQEESLQDFRERFNSIDELDLFEEERAKFLARAEAFLREGYFIRGHEIETLDDLKARFERLDEGSRYQEIIQKHFMILKDFIKNLMNCFPKIQLSFFKAPSSLQFKLQTLYQRIDKSSINIADVYQVLADLCSQYKSSFSPEVKAFFNTNGLDGVLTAKDIMQTLAKRAELQSSYLPMCKRSISYIR